MEKHFWDASETHCGVLGGITSIVWKGPRSTPVAVLWPEHGADDLGGIIGYDYQLPLFSGNWYFCTATFVSPELALGLALYYCITIIIITTLMIKV